MKYVDEEGEAIQWAAILGGIGASYLIDAGGTAVDVFYLGESIQTAWDNPSTENLMTVGENAMWAAIPFASVPAVKAIENGGKAAMQALDAAVDGARVAEKMHEHHLLPQQFKQFFTSNGRNLNINDFTMKIPESLHNKLPDGIHTVNGNVTQSWNKAWEAWIKQNKDATNEMVIEQMDKMVKEYGLEKYK